MLEQGFPGEVWQPASQRTDSSGRTAVYGYGTCPESGPEAVRLWEVSGDGMVCTGNYLPGNLVRETYKTEDWTSGRGGTADVYTDFKGNTVLERRWLAEGDEEKALDTYYVYDLLGRLRYVLPPMLSSSLSGNATVSSDDPDMLSWGYAYRYDGLGNCIWKRLPGCSPIVMKYDRHRRLVLSQDGNQASSGVWSAYWYDGQGRLAVSAECTLPYDGDVSGTGFTARYSGSGGPVCGYVLSPALPEGAGLQSVTYYDSYGFIDLAPEDSRDSLWAYVSAFPVPPVPSARPAGVLSDKDSTFLTPIPIPPVRVSKYDRYGRGRVTGGIMWSSDRSIPPLYSSVYYDDRGLVVQSHAQNHLGGWETEKTWYSFTGQPVKRTLSHTVGSAGSVCAAPRLGVSGSRNAIVERYAWTYDNMDRPLKLTHRLGNGPETVLADNSYDLLGRLVTDGRNGASGLVTSYSYNIRSWLTGKSDGVFSERLYYNSLPEDAVNAVPRYAGYISSSGWSFSGGRSRGYDYFYDGLGRLVGADSREEGLPGPSGTRYSYDGHGNIISLGRGMKTAAGVAETKYSMTYSGNRLEGMLRNGAAMVPDGIAGTMPAGMSEYAYDANGNMTRDLPGGLTSMSYNSLNLPEEMVAVSDGTTHVSRYVYGLDGTKQRVTSESRGGTSGPAPASGLASVCDSSSVSPAAFTSVSTVTDYCSNVVYRDGELDRILIDGGYLKDGEYRFFVTDHLGSVRAVTDAEGNVLHRYDYYPYGQEIADAGANQYSSADAPAITADIQSDGSGNGLSDASKSQQTETNAASQPYRFNGKESQEFAALPYLDYGARFYHPLSSRWTTMDPMAEKYYSVSTYAFCSNNPVNFVDVDGRDTVYVLDVSKRPNDRGVKGETYTGETYVEINGTIVGPYRSSSYPNSKSNHDNSPAANTINEGEVQFNNKSGHKSGSQYGLNIVNDKGERVADGTSPNGEPVVMQYVNIHSGTSDNGNSNSRGSLGCITIHPEDAESFFSNFDWIQGKHTGNSEGKVFIYRNDSSLKNEVYDYIKSKL